MKLVLALTVMPVGRRNRMAASVTEKKTGSTAATCSTDALRCDPGRIRTYNQMIKSHLRYRCATGPFTPLYEAVRLLTIRSER